jgi:hypothetical protein
MFTLVLGASGHKGFCRTSENYMTSVDDVDQITDQYRLGLGEFVKGNPEPVKELFSHRDDLTLANPLGPPVRGWEQVAATIERGASNIRDGEDLRPELYSNPFQAVSR